MNRRDFLPPYESLAAWSHWLNANYRIPTWPDVLYCSALDIERYLYDLTDHNTGACYNIVDQQGRPSFRNISLEIGVRGE